MDETNGSAATQNISGVSSVPRSNSRRKGNKANSEGGTGKLCDVKMSCTVWEGGDEKGLNLQHLVSALLHLEGGIRNRADLHLAGCLPYLWRSVKYEEVYLKDYQSVPDAVR